MTPMQLLGGRLRLAQRYWQTLQTATPPVLALPSGLLQQCSLQGVVLASWLTWALPDVVEREQDAVRIRQPQCSLQGVMRGPFALL